MSEEKKNLKNGKDLEALKERLKKLEAEEVGALPFTKGELVENELFSLRIPDGFSFEFHKDDFEVLCYQEDFSLTPLQITVKAEPLILVSPAEHFAELKNSILHTKGMTMVNHAVRDTEIPRFDLPTLGGKQMFFPLYHTTELFSLRINFAKKVENAAEITDKILASFAFKEFTPRIHQKAVASVCNVFERNRSNFAQSFLKEQTTVANGDAMATLCLNYANALYGCLRILEEQVTTMKQYDLHAADFQKLLALGEGICKDMAFSVDYEGETFQISTEQAKAMVENWKKL